MPESKAVSKGREKEDNRCFIFSHGVPGIEEITRFYIEPVAGSPFFFMLQAADDPGVGIILVDPFPFFPGYGFNLSKADQEELLVENAEDLLALTSVNVQENKFFTNLLAPFVLNTKNRLGKQIILPDKDDKNLRMALDMPSEVAAG